MLRIVLLLVGCIIFSDSTYAQDKYPNRPITIVVPYQGGAFPDVVARAFGSRLEQRLGVPVVIENKPGATGLLAVERLLQSSPDGYTLLLGDQQQWAINPLTTSKKSYDPQRDFEYVSVVATSPLFLVVKPSFGATSVAEAVALMRGNPGKFNYGSSGVASVHHLAMEMFKARSGDLKAVHIPFRGSAQTVPALLSGDIDLAFQAMPSIAALVSEGKLRIIGIATAERVSVAPEIPTLAESGIPVEFPVLAAFIVRKGTPPEIVNFLSTEIAKVAKEPEIIERFKRLSIITQGTTPGEASALIEADTRRATEAVRDAGLAAGQ